MRRLLSSLMVGALLLSTGCARTSAPERSLTPVQPVSSPQPSTATPAAPIGPSHSLAVDRIKAEWSRWDRTDEDAPDWIGLDDEDRVVVGGIQDLPYVNYVAPLAQKWMSHPEVARMLLQLKVWENRELAQGGVTVLSRQRYSTWGRVPPVVYASATQWATQVDAYAQFVDRPLYPVASLRQWVTAQVGNRLVQIDAHDWKASVVLQPGSLTENERVSEAVAIGAYAGLAKLSDDTSVTYQGVSRAGSIDVNFLNVLGWATYSNNPQDLRTRIKVDGVQAARTSNDKGPVYPAVDLNQWVADRSQWKQWLPKGAHLTIGIDRLSGTEGIIVVEADVPQDLSWEKVWEPYQEATAKLFAAAKGLYEIHFVLRQGQEMAFISWNWSHWQVRNLVAARSGGHLDPATFGPLSHNYLRFRTVTP